MLPDLEGDNAVIRWFSNNAPIRVKFKVLLVIYTTVALSGIVTTYLAAITPPEQAGIYPYIGGVMALLTVATALISGKVIGNPYVATVVRTEALAAGDFASPILFTDHRDCVGRLATALSTFRDNAQEIAAARAARKSSCRRSAPVSAGSPRAISADISTTPFPRITNNCVATITRRSTHSAMR